MAGVNADFHNQDLWDAIARGEYPVWKLYVQVLEPERAERVGRKLFDITKVWSQREVPLVEVGRMTLNKNVSALMGCGKGYANCGDGVAGELLCRD